MDIPDPLSPPLPIVYCFQQVFRVTSHIGTELLYVGCSWSSWLCSSMWSSPREYFPFEPVPTSLAVSHMCGSSNLDSFRGGWYVAVQLLLFWVLTPWLVQYFSQHSCVVAVKLFLSIRLVSVHVVHPHSSIDTTAAWKKLHFILSVRSDFYMTDNLLLAVHVFVGRVLMSVSVDEVNLSISFKELPFSVEMLPLRLKHIYSVSV